MKKINVILLALLLCSGLTYQSNAQVHEKGQMNLTVGLGYSLIGGLFDIATSGGATQSSFVTPVINGMFDYGVADKFSVGGAVSYQAFGYKYKDYFDYYDNNGQAVYADFKETWTCMNIGVRGLFHFGNSDKLGMYAGLRAGYTIWTYKNDYNGRTAYSEPDVSLGAFGAQPLFGIRYFFSDNIGINAEAGLGTYIVAAGLAVKF